KARLFALCLVAVIAAAGAGPSSASQLLADNQNLDPNLSVGLLTLLGAPVIDPTVDPPGQFHAVRPGEFDPAKTKLVQSSWLGGIGCPTNAFIAIPNSSFTGVAGTSPYTDTACTTGDPNDQSNMGLLMVKTGPTSNFAAAVAGHNNMHGVVV